MLSRDQLLHFAEHGWVLEEDVLTVEQIEAYKQGLDEQSTLYKAKDEDTEDITNITSMVNFDQLFRDWIMIPQVLEANRQLMGCEIKLECCHAMIKIPHPDRVKKREEFLDPMKHGWHRGIRPKWGTYAHDTDPDLINCTFLNNITYLTDVAPMDGGTMVLDGSHKHEGYYGKLIDQCNVVELTAKAGSILHFTESLIHAGVPILSENTRYTMFYGFTPSWYTPWPDSDVAPHVIEATKNEELRNILGGQVAYTGQESVL